MVKLDSKNVNDKSVDENKNSEKSTSDSEPSSSHDTKKLKKGISKYFKIGDAIDALDSQHGAWFEARIVDILKKENSVPDKSNEEPHITFRIKMER